MGVRYVRCKCLRERKTENSVEMIYTFKAVETQADNTTNNLGREDQKDTTSGWGSLLKSAVDFRISEFHLRSR